uniref:SAM domain-containing protein n=1 Tax=Anopheles atroparvus TaxID=41427 RepID=A0AAG5DQF1_ANOAO
MREVDTSETSVVWPAWCYSGETTVNEDLPQRLVAAAAAAAAAAATAAVSPSSIVLLAQQKQKQRARQQKDPQQHSSSNQSRSSSVSSASVSPSSSSSSSSPSPSPASPTSTHSPARPPGRSRGKRKSITRTTRVAACSQSPSVVAGSAIAAALEAGSVASASPGGLGLGQRSPPSSIDSACAATLCHGRSVGEGNVAARAPELLSTGQPTGKSVDERRDAEQEAERVPEHGSVKNYHFGAIDTRVLRQHQATLHSLDKMLSERIYDRKKYLNSPTGGGSASGGGVVPASASAFYEKLRNGGGASAAGDTGVGGAAMIESQLNLIKNGGPGGINGTSAHLSAIAASIISNNNNNNSNCSTNNNNNNGSNASDGNGSSTLGGNGSNGALASPRSSSSSNSSSSHQINSNKTSNSSSNNNNNNNNSNTNNNNISSSGSIKSERLSPANNDAQSMASRSRSVTPSSFSGTPPQTMHASEASFPSSIPSGGLLPSPSAVGANAVGRPELQARNYSDFMRSLAAKYNNNNNINDSVSNIKNSFPEPKMRFTQPKSYIEGSLSSKKGSPLTSTQVPNPSIMTSLFSGLPFQSAVFPPLIDMSSTQALVTLARAAKESEIHNILKTDTGGGLKKPSSLSRGSSPPTTSTSLSSHHFPSPFATGYLPGLLPNHHLASFPSQPPPSAALGGPLKSPSRAPEASTLSTTFPLDLSASTPSASKRLRLSSPTPSRHQETSPAPSSTNSQPSADGSLDLKTTRKCHARVEELAAWTVDNVCDFVASIDICAEYVQNFRDQSIDGAGLPLLTEEHLTNSLGMKLGPALKLRSMLAKKLGGPCPCALCSVPTPPPPPPVRTNSSGSGSSKGDTTPTNRPPSNGSIG